MYTIHSKYYIVFCNVKMEKELLPFPTLPVVIFNLNFSYWPLKSIYLRLFLFIILILHRRIFTTFSPYRILGVTSNIGAKKIEFISSENILNKDCFKNMHNLTCIVLKWHSQYLNIIFKVSFIFQHPITYWKWKNKCNIFHTFGQ